MRKPKKRKKGAWIRGMGRALFSPDGNWKLRPTRNPQWKQAGVFTVNQAMDLFQRKGEDEWEYHSTHATTEHAKNMAVRVGSLRKDEQAREVA